MSISVRTDDDMNYVWVYGEDGDRYLPGSYHDELEGNKTCPYCHQPVQFTETVEEGNEIRDVYVCTNPNPTRFCGREWWFCRWKDHPGWVWKFGN